MCVCMVFSNQKRKSLCECLTASIAAVCVLCATLQCDVYGGTNMCMRRAKGSDSVCVC